MPCTLVKSCRPCWGALLRARGACARLISRLQPHVALVFGQQNLPGQLRFSRLVAVGEQRSRSAASL